MSWNSSSYYDSYYNSSYYPYVDYNSSYPSPTPSSSPYAYFHSNDGGMPSGFVVMFVIIGAACFFGLSIATVRSCGGCSESYYQRRASQRPQARIISAPGVNNTYPNHVIDITSHNSYVQLVSTPQYQHDSIPLAVAVPSAPPATSPRDYPAPLAIVQFHAAPDFGGASGRSYDVERPVISIGSLPVAQDPAIVASRLPFDELTVHVLVSKDGFGRVYKGTYLGETVAIKKLLPETEKDLQHITAFLNEIRRMATLDHPNIVKYVGVSWNALSEVCAVTEFMEGGDLRAALTQFHSTNRPQGLDFHKATIALQVAHALAYMHSLYPVVLHQDLKSTNVLLDKTQTLAKLTDIGVSCEREGDTMTAAVGTLLWMAPEVMTGERYDDKADIFSFGVILSELDTYAMPYADVKAQMVSESGRPLPDTALLQRIMTGRVSVSFSDALEEDVKALAKKCLSLDPHMRPSASQVRYELEKITRRL